MEPVIHAKRALDTESVALGVLRIVLALDISNDSRARSGAGFKPSNCVVSLAQRYRGRQYRRECELGCWIFESLTHFPATTTC